MSKRGEFSACTLLREIYAWKGRVRGNVGAAASVGGGRNLPRHGMQRMWALAERGRQLSEQEDQTSAVISDGAFWVMIEEFFFIKLTILSYRS